MQLKKPPPGPPPSSVPPTEEEETLIKGDPASRKFGLVFLASLAIITIGAGIGIGVGNIAHYRYFGQYNETAVYNNTLFNLTFSPQILTKMLLSSSNERLKKREFSRKARAYWLSINRSPDDDDDHS